TAVSAQGRGRTVAVAAASDLQTVLPALAADFEKATGITAVVTFGSSGSFFAQIQNGAPFDVFMSADVDYPRRLAEAGQADKRTLYRYATGELVVWVRKDSGLDVLRGLALVRDPRVRHIAIANPMLAPYGRAAVAALQSEHLYDAVRDRLVRGDNISQTAQLVQSGNAEVGLLSHSTALGPSMQASGTLATVPSGMYPSIVQAAVMVSASAHRDAAQAFLQYLKSAAARKTLAAFGFGPPPAAR
ncbi:MAG TPA: molybdate ABC transporter substrate-binding protein, partial [Vicinamibacterales bacterium]|nr:molybdate ABC transporter substrate-binding protein [Vicinamibacterales bacterium]